MAKIGVVLSGCGFLDGSEIHEATLTLLHLDRLGAEIVFMAPDNNDIDVTDHYKKQPVQEKRNILAESARIARTDIVDIASVEASQLDALVFPGGFGAAINLCDWALKGENCDVNPDVERLIKDMHQAKKPLGFLCIAPVLAARVLGSSGVTLTIGNDENTASVIAKTGAKHEVCDVDQAVFDEENLIATTPAYMIGPSISKVDQGISKLVQKLMDWAK